MPALKTREDLERVADQLVGEEKLGERKKLPESWVPGDLCPMTNVACTNYERCWSDGECPLRTTLTSKLAAAAGRYLAKWAAEAGAEGMCNGCALREGTRANRTDSSIIDLVDALKDGHPFWCHDGIAHGHTPKEVCRGWQALARSTIARDLRRKAGFMANPPFGFAHTHTLEPSLREAMAVALECAAERITHGASAKALREEAAGLRAEAPRRRRGPT